MEEGAIYAMCMVSQGDQATLARWITGLQETNPILGHIPTVFRLDSGPRELQDLTDSQQPTEPDAEVEHRTDHVVEEEQALGGQRVKQ